MSRMVSFFVLVAVIAVIGFLFYRVISAFLLPMFLAALLVVIFRPWHRWLVERCGGRVRLAAALTTATVVLVVIVPASMLVSLVTWELLGSQPTAAGAPTIERSVRQRLESLRRSFGLELPYANQLHYVEASLQSLLDHAAAGATYQGDEQSLAKLAALLDDLHVELADSRHAHAAESLAALATTVREAGGDPQLRAGTFAFQSMLATAQQQFRQFKVTLVGGPGRTMVVELVNPTEEQLRGLTSRLTAVAPGLLRTVGGATGSFVIGSLVGGVIMIIALYFFLADGARMVSTVMRLSPLDDEHERELVAEFDRVSRAVVLATLLSALAQGLLAGVGYWIISLFVENFEIVFTLTLVTALLALVPFVGAAAVWLPTSLWLLFNQNYALAVLLAAYGAGVVSMADNVVKPLVLHGQSNLHPLLALLSVLGGVQALGPIGILVGPMVVVFLQTLLNILHRELVSSERRGGGGRRRGALPFILSLRRRGLRLPYAAPSASGTAR